MALAETFQEIVWDSLPDDWTDLELDLRIFDERRYVDAAVLLVTCNAQPYSKNDWHWRLLVAHRFGNRGLGAGGAHGAACRLDEAGIDGEMAVREARTGRAEVKPDVGPDRVRARRDSGGSAPSSRLAAQLVRSASCSPAARSVGRRWR